MSRPPFQFGQRCERMGYWQPGEPGDWVFGSVVAFSAASVTVKDNNGRDMAVSAARTTWKKTMTGWAIWAPWVAAMVMHIEEDERIADRLGVGHLRLFPLVGDYVVVHKLDQTHAGFISRIEGDAVGVTRGTPDEQGRNRFTLRRAHLHWDDTHGFWRARSGAPQEKRL